MVTDIIGKKFLKIYNETFGKSYSAKSFFMEIYYPLFYDSNKYMQWVQNSPFVQMKKGQKVENLNEAERKEKLKELINKIDGGAKDASIALGFPASEDKDFATTSGQVTNLDIKVSADEIYLSWIGSGFGVGVQSGFSILFDNKKILLDIFDGWKFYRKVLDNTPNLRGNQISTWNGQWLAHKYDERLFVEDSPMANFAPFTTKDELMSIEVQSWTKILIAISKKIMDSQIIGYVYTFSKTNKTIGFIPFILEQIRRPIDLYQKLFGMEEGRKAEELYGTAYGFIEACQVGSIGIKAMEPKGLRDYFEKGKFPKFNDFEEQTINFHTYIIWIIAMLNNEDMWVKAQDFAKELQEYAMNSDRGKVVNSRKVDAVIGSTNKINFIKNLVEVVTDATNKDKIAEAAELVNAMPADNVPYYLSLVRFNYAAINNKKNKIL
jgi:hypothetical protein